MPVRMPRMRKHYGILAACSYLVKEVGNDDSPSPIAMRLVRKHPMTGQTTIGRSNVIEP